MISMQFVQVRFNRKCGLYFKHNQLGLYVNLVCFDSIGSKDNLVE